MPIHFFNSEKFCDTCFLQIKNQEEEKIKTIPSDQIKAVKIKLITQEIIFKENQTK